jgi:hypothetical protein
LKVHIQQCAPFFWIRPNLITILAKLLLCDDSIHHVASSLLNREFDSTQYYHKSVTEMEKLASKHFVDAKNFISNDKPNATKWLSALGQTLREDLEHRLPTDVTLEQVWEHLTLEIPTEDPNEQYD